MAELSSNRYRFKIVAGAQTNWTEQITNKTFAFPSGVDLTLQFAIMETQAVIYDITDVASLTLELKALASGEAPAAGAATLMGKTITPTVSAANGQIDDATITVADFDARTAQHATFLFTDDESNIAPGNYWLVLSALLSDGSRVSIAWGKVTIIQDGTGPVVAPDPADPSYALSSDLAAYRTIARSVDHLRDFTGLTGGTATDLDSIATVGLPVRTTASLVIADALQVWQLQAGTTAENATGGIVRPDDYAAATNEKIWIRVL